MFSYILKKIDNTTMYRVVLYTLGTWAVYAVILSLVGLVAFNPLALLASLGTISSASVLAHYVLRWGSGATAANVESSLITAFILFFVLEPGSDVASLAALAAITVVAVLSKYVLCWRHVHIFNPVAVGIVATGLLGVGFATWWIGSPAFFPLVLLGGAIITQKIRRWQLVTTTLGVGFVSYVAVALWLGTFTPGTLTTYWYSWPMLFFVVVMVTEPLSTPAGVKYQLWYATFIGVLSAIPFSLGFIDNSLAVTLLIANAVVFPLQLMGRPRLTLQSVREVADHIYEFVFKPSFRFAFVPGQYLEWAVPHSAVDSRGIRRYFTIASAPEANEIVLGVKMSNESSSFKTALSSLVPGDSILVSSLDGDFTLPTHPSKQPLVFIAGGIGVTPYRSMVEHLLATNTPVDATLYYFVRTEAEIAWRELWHAGKAIGLTTVYVVAEPNSHWTGETGTLTPELINRYVINPQLALFYLSGPPGMVRAFTGQLTAGNIHPINIKRDYFPGLA